MYFTVVLYYVAVVNSLDCIFVQVEKNVARPLNSSEQFFSTMEKHTNSGTGRFLELAADTKVIHSSLATKCDIW